MKKLLFIVIILCTFGVLHAQETSPAADKAALIAHLETAAGFVIGGVVGNVAGPALLYGSAFGYGNSVLGMTGFVLTPVAYLATTIAYSNFLENYNAAFPSDKQIMLPFLLLTLGGTAAIIPNFLTTQLDPFGAPPPTEQQIAYRNATFVLAVTGIVAHFTGMAVSIVHTQELLAKAKTAGSAPASQDRRQPADRTIVTPEIGIGYLGVAISMP